MRSRIVFTTVFEGDKYDLKVINIDPPDDVLKGIESDEKVMILRAAIAAAVAAAQKEFERAICSRKYSCKFEKDGVLHHLTNDK